MITRDYGSQDLELCLEVFSSNVPDFFQEGERAEFSAFLSDLPGPYLVCVDQSGEAIACGGYAVNERTGTADLCWGMVRRERHGQGYGRALTRTRIERAIANPSVTEVALNTSQHTVGFYERLGFRTTAVIKDGYGPGLDRCEMRRAVDR